MPPVEPTPAGRRGRRERWSPRSPRAPGAASAPRRSTSGRSRTSPRPSWCREPASRRLSRRSSPRSSASVAARVAATGSPMPPPSYGIPAMRAENSAARSPAKTRWLWLSTNPGTTARPPTSTLRSAAGAARPGPTQATRPPSTTTAASTTIPRRSPAGTTALDRRLAVRSGAGDELADAGDTVALIRSPITRHRGEGVGEQPPDVAGAVPARRGRRVDRATTTSVTSAAVAEKSIWPARSPAVRGLSRRTATRSARCADGEQAAVVPAEGAVAVQGGRGEQLGRRRTGRARWLARRSFISTPRASSKGSMTACWSEPSDSGDPGVGRRASRADAVGEVAFGGGAEAARSSGRRRGARRRRRTGGSRARPWSSASSSHSAASSSVGEQP